jgi:hypothetical protein
MVEERVVEIEQYGADHPCPRFFHDRRAAVSKDRHAKQRCQWDRPARLTIDALIDWRLCLPL